MHKIIFLEYKFRDFTDAEIMMPGPTGVMSAYEKLNNFRLNQIRSLNLQLGISFVVMPGRNSCPLDPEVQRFSFNQLKSVVELNPDVIWFDYLKFPGKWKILDKTSDYMIHKECKYCKGKDRQKVISVFAGKLVDKVPIKIKTGVFTMPLIMGDYNNWQKILGQNLEDLGKLFDYISPMLYHRMIKKPVEYINEHVGYLKGLGISAQIIPIVQLKDMPDDLEDCLTEEEFEKAVHAASKKPSEGVAIFSWDQAIEKNKLELASKILRSLE